MDKSGIWCTVVSFWYLLIRFRQYIQVSKSSQDFPSVLQYSDLDRSEGEAERDIGSLRMMGWGLMLAENSSAAAVAAAAVPSGWVIW